MKRIISLALFCLLSCSLFSQDAITSFDSVTFTKGEVLLNEQPYTGSLRKAFPNGRVNVNAQVVNGRLHGVTKLFHENGQTHMILQYKDGNLCCTVTCYFETGQLKFKAELGKQSKYGGNELDKFNFGFYKERGGYVSGYKSGTRFQLITFEGLSAFFNGHVPPHKIAAFRVFNGKKVNHGMFIEDSRKLVVKEE